MKWDKHIDKMGVCVLLCSITQSAVASLSTDSSLASVSQSQKAAFLDSLSKGHAVLQLGGYWSAAGASQHINIQGLIGDDFTVVQSGGSNGLVGVGYFLKAPYGEAYQLRYGVNAFYLPSTSVTGHVVQESLYTNLSYRYNLTHYPIYAMGQAEVKTKWPGHDVVLDVGIGPNFMQLQQFKESPLALNTLPDMMFYGHGATVFSATVGASIKLNQLIGQLPLACGYRFFYLGQANFSTASSQVLDRLSTGGVYANALMCTVSIE
jgi:hypothetical protein